MRSVPYSCVPATRNIFRPRTRFTSTFAGSNGITEVSPTSVKSRNR